MKKTITVKRFCGYIGGKPESYATEVLAEIYGPFGVYKNTDAIDEPWEVVHIGTGLGVTNGHRYPRVARRIARALEKQPGWDFTTVAEFAPRAKVLGEQVRAAREAEAEVHR
jgi:hypothetical protein